METDRRMVEDPARDDVLVLVDGLDRKIGTATKMKTHTEGLLHRAFSVVLIKDGEAGPELLLAKRAAGKYHSAGLWANTCCSHPREGEETIAAAYRRVEEELGCTAIDLHELCAFIYRAPFDNGICEHEYDHVLIGGCEGEPSFDPSEVAEVRWVGVDALADELAACSEKFAAWAPTVLSLVMRHIL